MSITPIMKKNAVFLGLFFSLLLVSGFGLKAQPLTTFPNDTYVVLAKSGTPFNHTIYTTTTPANSSSFATGPTIDFSPSNVDGIGLNVTDKFLYAAGNNDNGTSGDLSDDGHLYRIGANGSFVNLGILPITGNGATINLLGINSKAEYVNILAGTVSGNSYIYPTIVLTQAGVSHLIAVATGFFKLNFTTSHLKIYIAQINNISSLTSTPSSPSSYYELNLTTDTKVKTAFEGFLKTVNDNFNNTPGSFTDKIGSLANVKGGFQDLDVNPTNGKLYSYFNYQGTSGLLGIPIVLNAPSGGKSVVNAIENVNSTPSTENVGLAFDNTGNFYGLFASGQYGKINLTTGVVENLTSSNIPTVGGVLSADYARGIPSSLSAKFGEISAKIINNQLVVSWNTLAESDNSHFYVEVSKDGSNFKRINQEVIQSKVTSGNSDSLVSYQFTIDINSTAAVLGLSLLGLGIFGFSGNRRYLRFLIVLIGFFALGFGACSKSQDAIKSGTESLFVRIAQVDKDGTVTYSKVIKAVKE